MVYKIKFLGRYVRVKPVGFIDETTASGKKYLAIKAKVIGDQKIKDITGGHIIVPTSIYKSKK